MQNKLEKNMILFASEIDSEIIVDFLIIQKFPFIFKSNFLWVILKKFWGIII